MDEIVFSTGIVLLTIGFAGWFILSEISNAKRTITDKQDALMKKLIEIKLR
jgi:hypothetical protein